MASTDLLDIVCQGSVTSYLDIGKGRDPERPGWFEGGVHSVGVPSQGKHLDLLLAVINMRLYYGDFTSLSIPSPTVLPQQVGWTTLSTTESSHIYFYDEAHYTGAFEGVKTYIFSRYVQNGDPASYDFGFTRGTFGVRALIARYSNVDIGPAGLQAIATQAGVFDYDPWETHGYDPITVPAITTRVQSRVIAIVGAMGALKINGNPIAGFRGDHQIAVTGPQTFSYTLSEDPLGDPINNTATWKFQGPLWRQGLLHGGRGRIFLTHAGTTAYAQTFDNKGIAVDHGLLTGDVVNIGGVETVTGYRDFYIPGYVKDASNLKSTVGAQTKLQAKQTGGQGTIFIGGRKSEVAETTTAFSVLNVKDDSFGDWTTAIIALRPDVSAGLIVQPMRGDGVVRADATVLSVPRLRLKGRAKLQDKRRIAHLVGTARCTGTPVQQYTIKQTIGFTQETYIQSENPDDNHGPAPTINLGFDGSNENRIIIEFPLRALRAGSIIDGAEIGLTTTQFPSTTKVATVERLLRYDWDHSTATWNEFVRGSAWDTPGGDVGETPDAFTFNIPASGNPTISGAGLVAMIQDAIDKRAARLLLRIRTTSSELIKFASGHSVDQTVVPSLVINVKEGGVGYPRTGIKHLGSAWLAARELSSTPALYMAFGIGDSPEENLYRRRLQEEIYRLPITGMRLDPSNFSGELWSIAAPNTFEGDITEIGLFSSDKTEVLSDEDVSLWTGGSWQLEADTVRKQGEFSIKAYAGMPTSDSISLENFSRDLSTTSGHVWLQGWIKADNPGFITDLSIRLTDDGGTWTWTDLQSLIGTGFTHLMLNLKDATSTSTLTGLNILNKIEIIPVTSGAVTINIDYFRLIPEEEEILAWIRPRGGIKSKRIDSGTKFRVRLKTQRSTNH